MDHDEARARLLDAAERLFYERGIQAVGMDEIRTASAVPLKRLYQYFPSKSHLVEEYLRRRDERWRSALADYASRHGATPRERLLAVFDWLHAWFAEPGFRGCAFINAYGELGATSDAVAVTTREHKDAVRAFVAGLVGELHPAEPEPLTAQVMLLMDGAITTASLSGDPSAARHARAAAETLLAAVRP
ncbi:MULTISPECIES: TetR/AcrR family transcriptional regulator [Streptomyces]|uniref:TetR/AcrR family transcriptional regulator n=1 Tax=Streptomyces luteosporeus TaxID=173856 RepID=A0ABP6G9Z6_9ACTN